MQRHSKHSTSTGRSHPTWRFSHTTKRRASERPHSQKRSDLGSDEEWQLTMASDSDVDEPEAPVANPPLNDSSQDVDADPLAVQWHDADEESFLDDVKQSKMPSVPHHSSALLPANQPVYGSPNRHSPDFVAAGFDNTLPISKSPTSPVLASAMDKDPPPTKTPVPNEYDADTDADDHPVIIPGYRGASSRAAVANRPVTTLPGTAQRTSTWADRPRGNPVPLLSNQTAADNNSRQSSPGLIRTPCRADSDCAPSSQTDSAGSCNSLPVSNSTSSVPLDGSHEVAPKSMSFVAERGSKSPSKSPLQDDVGPTGATSVTTSTPSSGKNADSVKTNTRKTSSIRLTLRDGRARLIGGRLSASKREHRRQSAARGAPLQGALTENSTSVFRNDVDPAVPPSLRNVPQHQLGTSSAMRTLSNQRLSARSDEAFPRRISELSQGSPRNGRPLSTPSHMSSANLDSPTAWHAPRVTLSAGSAFPASSRISAFPILSRRRGFHGASAPPKDLSFLECVVEILKGTNAARRKRLMNVQEGQMWLTPDMQAVQYRMGKKRQLAVTRSLALARVRTLKGMDREIVIETIDQRKSLEFLFQSRERADVWLSALCCLVPSHATVQSRHQRLELRETYDPLADTWNGKTVASRKKLNQFILLGSIGKGSFAKVKLALSVEDRQFYAVKVLQKAVMRRKMMGTPLDRGIRETVPSSPLTIGDVNEIVVMKALNHENVTKLKGVFDDPEEGRLYLVLEFLAQGPIMSSSTLNGANSITENRARTAFVDVLCGLQYLHSNNIVHRDIKPDNLLQAGDGTVKISDFGAALLYTGDDRREADECQSYETIVGTPAFNAPEFCLCDESPPRPARCYEADIWSLGATLFYMIYGCVPFQAKSMFEMFHAICTQELVFPVTPTVSTSLKDLVREMMRKVPEDRATIASIISSPWLTESAEVADKLAKIRSALLEQSDGTSEERRRGLPSNRQVPDVASRTGRVGNKKSSS